ncbi:MAG: N-acetylmuramoyl-L-alanine amidase [Peptococcaceae bacterium]|nr:N-acetylmuramoyl-L-alanine amidase [Peptococcaceae bacterium]
MSSKVIINPGHGPKNSGVFDPGAVGPSRIREADVNLAVAKLLKPLLEAAGAQVLLVRDGDLSDVVNTANVSGADYFVSIHCNAAADPAAHGTETYIYSENSKAMSLAKAIQAAAVEALGATDRGVKVRPGLYVLRKTVMPALLIELAFVSNPAEEQILASAGAQNRIALALANAIKEQLGLRPGPDPAADEEIRIFLHGAQLVELSGKLIDGTTYLPARVIAEAWGFRVDWQPGRVDVWPA